MLFLIYYVTVITLVYELFIIESYISKVSVYRYYSQVSHIKYILSTFLFTDNTLEIIVCSEIFICVILKARNY